MKKVIGLTAILFTMSRSVSAQKDKSTEHINVPSVVKTALYKQYPNAKHETWEKENGNYEANWGGKSGEDYSVQFTPSGKFIEIVIAMPVSDLPKPVIMYVNEHYNGSKITEAGKVTDSDGKIFYETEVRGKDLTFDKNGNFVKAEK